MVILLIDVNRIYALTVVGSKISCKNTIEYENKELTN